MHWCYSSSFDTIMMILYHIQDALLVNRQRRVFILSFFQLSQAAQTYLFLLKCYFFVEILSTTFTWEFLTYNSPNHRTLKCLCIISFLAYGPVNVFVFLDFALVFEEICMYWPCASVLSTIYVLVQFLYPSDAFVYICDVQLEISTHAECFFSYDGTCSIKQVIYHCRSLSLTHR